MKFKDKGLVYHQFHQIFNYIIIIKIIFGKKPWTVIVNCIMKTLDLGRCMETP